MRVLVVGASGCVGRAVVQALRGRGHRVVPAARRASATDIEASGAASSAWCIDFMAPVAPAAWAERLRAEHIEAVVNCAGILMQREGQRFERVHTQGPIELFEGAAAAGVQRVVQISALGAADGTSPYLASKRAADNALLALPLQATVLRPSLLLGPGCASTALFATLAALPVVALPGGGQQALRPIHVYEVAEIVARCIERREAATGVFDIGGGQTLSYREMLHTYRRAVGAGEPHSALWLPLPMALMRASARAAECLPQQVLCRQTIALLERGSVPPTNAAAALLGRTPSTLAEGLRVTPPQPLVDLRVTLSPAAAGVLRGALVLMWLWVAAVSALLPQASGVLPLLQRCGFESDAAWWALAASCLLNTGLGLATWLRPGASTYALQMAAIVGYTAVAAWNVPALTLDHCGALVKNLPLLAAVLLLWMGTPGRPDSRGGQVLRVPAPKPTPRLVR